MESVKRRDFIRKASVAAVGAAGVVSACASEKTNTATAARSTETFNWKMVTTWPPHFPILGVGAEKFAEWVDVMSEGRLKIQVYGGGELVPPLLGKLAELGHRAHCLVKRLNHFVHVLLELFLLLLRVFFLPIFSFSPLLLSLPMIIAFFFLCYYYIDKYVIINTLTNV